MYNPWVNSSEFPLEQAGVKDGEIWAFDLARSIWVSAAAWLRPACLLAVIYGCVPVGGEGVYVGGGGVRIAQVLTVAASDGQTAIELQHQITRLLAHWDLNHLAEYREIVSQISFTNCTSIIISRQHTDTRYWYSNFCLSVCPSVTFRYSMKTA